MPDTPHPHHNRAPAAAPIRAPRRTQIIHGVEVERFKNESLRFPCPPHGTTVYAFLKPTGKRAVSAECKQCDRDGSLDPILDAIEESKRNGGALFSTSNEDLEQALREGDAGADREDGDSVEATADDDAEAPTVEVGERRQPDNLSYARYYARHGLFVFPCWWVANGVCACGDAECSKNQGKHPIGALVARGVLDATRDLRTIKRWWTQYPSANIAVAAGLSGLILFDIDPRHGGDEMDLVKLAGEGIRDTIRTLTPSGGLHLWLAQPADGEFTVSTDNPSVGIDIRAGAGYVMLPPSRHLLGEYRFEIGHSIRDIEVLPCPAVLADLARKPVRKKADSSAHEPLSIDDARDMLTVIDADDRQTWLDNAMALKSHFGQSGRPLWDQWSQTSKKYEAKDQDKTWDSIDVDGGITIGTLVKRARDGGWARPAKESAAPQDPGKADVVTTDRQLPARKAPEALDNAALHGLVGEFVRLIDPHTESSMAAVAVQFLVSAGNLVGRNPHRIIDGSRHSTNLMAVIVGDTSSSRKGTSFAQNRRLYALADEGWVKDRVSTGLSSGEGLIWAVRDPLVHREAIKDNNGRATGDYELVETDPGVDDKRLLVVESEFMRVLKMGERDGNTLSICIRQGWDSGDLGNLTKNNPLKATGAHLSIIGHITRDELLRGLNSTEAANGFANRFLWVHARRSKLLPFGGDLPDSAFSSLIARLRAARDWCSERPRHLEFSGEASRIWSAVYPALSADRVGLLGAVVARAPAQVVRLACIYAVLDRSGQIETDHLRAAIAVWGYCETSAGFIFGDRLGDPDADAILGALRSSSGGMTRTEIRDLFSRHLSADRIERALMTLATHHLAMHGSTTTGGRPVEIWRAHKTTEPT